MSKVLPGFSVLIHGEWLMRMSLAGAEKFFPANPLDWEICIVQINACYNFPSTSRLSLMLLIKTFLSFIIQSMEMLFSRRL